MGARGPKPKEKTKRISGTGYTYAESRNLKYCKKAEDGTFEIDTEAIKKAVDAYIADNKGEDKALSRPALRKALGYISRETYDIWLMGYTNRAHIGNDEYECNQALSDVIRAGDTEIIIHLTETCDKYGDTKRIKLLQSYGEIAPDKQQLEVSGGIKLGLGSLSKFAQ